MIDKAPESRVPALLALLAVGGLYWALPSSLGLQFGPRWFLFAIVAVLLVPTVFTLRLKLHDANRIFGYTVLVIVTLALIYSLILLVVSLPASSGHHLSSGVLLRSAACLWLTNVIVFALWYWRLDAGGPHERDLRGKHEAGAFLFPQMTLSEDVRTETCQEHWSPTFIDYLFLAFNHSTALSPTDTAILSRWAKLLIMLQAIISLTILALVAAHAVNALQ